jgi:hypothetical protein
LLGKHGNIWYAYFMKRLPSSSTRLFQVGASSYLYPSFVQSDGLRWLYRALLKFLVASTRQFWFFFGAWGAGALVVVLRLQDYAFWLVGVMTAALIVITVLEWSKLSEQEKN